MITPRRFVSPHNQRRVQISQIIPNLQQFFTNANSVESLLTAMTTLPTESDDETVSYESELDTLASMGFTNREVNLNVLRRTRGVIERAVEILISESS